MMFVLGLITGIIAGIWLYLNFKVVRMVIQKKFKGIKIYWWFFIELMVLIGATTAFISQGKDSVMSYIIVIFCLGMFIPALFDIVKNGQDELDKPADGSV